MSSKWKYEEKKERNFMAEAKQLINGLKDNQLYKLYQIVLDQKPKSRSEERDKELNAVQESIEQIRGLDKSKLYKMRQGYGSEMAATANAKDGNKKPFRKQV